MTNVLTKNDVQKILQITDKQNDALFKTEGFPCFRIGRQYRIFEDDLREFLSKNNQITLDYSKV